MPQDSNNLIGKVSTSYTGAVPQTDVDNSQTSSGGILRTGSKESRQRKPKRPNMTTQKPTHFIAIPLHTNIAVRSRISAFQSALLKYSQERRSEERVRGLHPSIVIDPRRFHLTLGVMALEEEHNVPGDAISGNSTRLKDPLRPAKTVASALALLHSLKPALTRIMHGTHPPATSPPTTSTTNTLPELSASSRGSDLQREVPRELDSRPLRIVLNQLHVMDPVRPPNPKTMKAAKPAISISEEMRKTSRDEIAQGGGVDPLGPSNFLGDEIWAKVLYVAPEVVGGDGAKLLQISDLIHKTFKREGYVTDKRPLKLHCTVLNASKRQPSRMRGLPFSYSDILKSGTLRLLAPLLALGSSPSESYAASDPLDAGVAPNGGGSACAVLPPQVAIDFGTEIEVEEVQLWIMGSRGPNNEYLSCGGVRFC